MTIDQIRKSREPLLLASDVADVLKMNPNSLRRQAHDNPELLGFPVMVTGRTVKIPRIPFLKFLGSL